MSQQLVLVGGERSGKSTVAGALIKHISLEKDLNEAGFYQVEDQYKETFDNSVLNPMNNELKYPDQTPTGYAVQITVPDTQSTFLSRSEKLNIYDIGGEFQTGVLGDEEYVVDLSYLNNYKEVNLDPLRENLDSLPLIGDMHDEIKLNIDYESLASFPQPQRALIIDFIESVINSYGIIFLLNLALLKEADMPRWDSIPRPSQLDTKVVRDKPKKALLVTGCDCIDYTPDPYHESVTTSLFNKKMYDSNLYYKIRDHFQDPEIMNLMNVVDNIDSFDLFGVAVPSAKDEESSNMEANSLQVAETGDGGDTFVTEGFETLIRWINK